MSEHRIELSRGATAIVCDVGLPIVSGMRWCLSSFGYAVRGVYSPEDQKTGIQYMHRLILGAKAGQTIDHINGIKTDNRLENLRFCQQSENSRNSRRRSDNTSGFKGVTKTDRDRPWVASIHIGGKRKHLGLFATPEEAARAYDRAAVEHYGEFARLNF